MILIRLSKIVMVAGLALWALLVTLGNIMDHGSNWAFVQHVLAMDTIFPDSNLKWRAISDPTLQTVAYVAIIVTEGLTTVAFAIAAWMMAANVKAPKTAFQKAKSFTAVGVILGFGLWFVGFIVIGGEWFAMWQSETWNGLQAAFRFTMIILAIAVYVFLDNDGEPEPVP